MNEGVGRRSRLPIACDSGALTPEQRERKSSIQRRLRADVQEILELHNGYAFRHSSESSVVLAAAEFVTLERICCPFFDFEMEVEHGGGPLWLRITGEEQAKQVLRAQLAPSPEA